MMYLTPYPATAIYNDIEKYGTLENNWNKMNAHVEPCFVPYGLTKADLIKYKKKAYREFYLRPKIILSYLLQIKKPSQAIVLLRGFSSLLKLWFAKDKQRK